MRIDKLISDMGLASRKEAAALAKRGQVFVDGDFCNLHSWFTGRYWVVNRGVLFFAASNNHRCDEDCCYDVV